MVFYIMGAPVHAPALRAQRPNARRTTTRPRRRAAKWTAGYCGSAGAAAAAGFTVVAPYVT